EGSRRESVLRRIGNSARPARQGTPEAPRRAGYGCVASQLPLDQACASGMTPSEALTRIAERATPILKVPTATYRLQIGKGLGFHEVTDLVPYLHDLGISDCYFSPFLQASTPDSHGYDIADHGNLNTALGSASDYEALCRALAERGMGQIVDVVPNHMGI